MDQIRMLETEPSQEENKTSENTTETPKEIGKGAFAKIHREIKESALSNPDVGRLLLDERDRLITENAKLEIFKDKFYEADKRAAIAEETIGGEDKFKVLYSFVLTVGGILVGLWPSLTGDIKTLVAISGLVLLLVGLLLALLPRKNRQKNEN